MDKKTMLASYEKYSKADFYKIGFDYNGMVYAVTVYAIPEELTKVDKASRKNGGYMTLRIRLTKKQKTAMIPYAETICTITEFEKLHKNKGNAFEKAIARQQGKTARHNNIPFWVDGDVRINNKAVQLKYERATICNAHTLEILGTI